MQVAVEEFKRLKGMVA